MEQGLEGAARILDGEHVAASRYDLVLRLWEVFRQEGCGLAEHDIQFAEKDEVRAGDPLQPFNMGVEIVEEASSELSDMGGIAAAPDVFDPSPAAFGIFA